MTTTLRLRTANMSPVTEDGSAASPQTPARGKETRAALLQKLRVPQLIHAWDCWIERPSNASDAKIQSSNPSSTAETSYKPHLTQLTSVTDVRAFWSLFNNLPLESLQLRTSCHLFHKTITPVWEDPRNARGGSWTFRISRSNGVAFFTEICLLAIGEHLQEAVDDDTRTFFRDDICGVSFSPRSASLTLVSIWNRDGGNEMGIGRILETVLSEVTEEIIPKEGNYYYKKHSEHDGFLAPATTNDGTGVMVGEVKQSITVEPKKETADEEGSGPARTMAQMEEDVKKVRQILEELKTNGASTTGAATGV